MMAHPDDVSIRVEEVYGALAAVGLDSVAQEDKTMVDPVHRAEILRQVFGEMLMVDIVQE
jgi:hypothetical protein